MRKIYSIILLFSVFTAFPSFSQDSSRIYWHLYMWCEEYLEFYELKYSVTEELWATMVELSVEEAFSIPYEQVRRRYGIRPQGIITLGWVRGIAYRGGGDFSGTHCVESGGSSGCRRWEPLRVHWSASWSDPAYVHGMFSSPREEESDFDIWLNPEIVIREDGTWLQVVRGRPPIITGGPLVYGPRLQGGIAYENPFITFAKGGETTREKKESVFDDLIISRRVPPVGAFIENTLVKGRNLLCYYRIQRTFERRHFGWMVSDNR